MSWVDDAVRDFARGMGLDAVSLPEAGALSFKFERRGTLYLERVEDGLLIYLARAIDYVSPQLLRAALRACHYRALKGSGARAGFHDGSLVFLLRLPEAEVSLPTLDRALEQLTELHDQVAA